jgi:hypothetical protein
MEKNSDSKKIKDEVLNSIKNKENLFMLRMGDGEMIIAYNIEDKIDFFCKKQFGRSISTEELYKIQNWMRESVLESSILGIPDRHHIKSNSLWKMIFKYYEEIRKESNILWKSKSYCSINSHFEILESGYIYEIFSFVEKIVIVSPRDIRNNLKMKYPNIKEIEYYSIPGEQAYEIDKNKEIDIFDRIEEIILSIKSKSRKGELLIFGAGPIGKILGSEFSKAGGVSLDLGSVFDLFIGKITRGKGKGPNRFKKPIL